MNFIQPTLLSALAIPTTLLLMTSCGEKPSQAPPARPPQAVIVATVEQKTVPIYVENVAQTEANATVEIRARVQGFLMDAPFKEGGYVKKGDLLFQIDPKPYQAAVDQAQANVTKADATLGRANADVDRIKPLVEQRAISQQELDNAIATAKVAEADLLAARAGLTTAQLELGYTTMRAPFDGLIGARQVDVGNFVGNTADTTLLATISTTDPMRATFHVAEANYLRYQRRFMGDEAAAEEHSAAMAFDLILSDGSTYAHKGKFDFAERALDARAGTLKLVVTFPNPELLLRPGQFARVRAMPEERPDAILVPQRAVITTQSAQSVMVVGEGNKVEVRPIKTSTRFQDQWIVTTGLKAGEKVIIEGLQKAAPGIVVNPMDPPPDEAPAAEPAKPSATPAAEEAPSAK
ncbi:efflux RND transporter periplasmic adaptor subunit [Phragmitibacter flavus]|uniref:Efflux RND transporter periplasmic adaptor subunit n=1 Tax=Phragmitibacter flavus TaxID=2576071 RepID=A0A5R8KHF6_9BACT|nr:efflux RND transporter periplasmic adaptor subunit [Phragmitibacter flavus]TLD71744.1 efflux RND transporter periplasmic adaptor subunit [Phragmitibacter flavus]